MCAAAVAGIVPGLGMPAGDGIALLAELGIAVGLDFVGHLLQSPPVNAGLVGRPASSAKRLRGMLADRPRAVAALTKIFLDGLERLLCAAAGSLEHLRRYCARPPFALERLSVIRDADGRIIRIRYVLPRHKATNWVGRGRGRKSTRPGANGVVERTPFAGRMPARWSSQTLALAATALRRQGPGMALPTECQRDRLADLVPVPRNMSRPARSRPRVQTCVAAAHPVVPAVPALSAASRMPHSVVDET